ncbi:MAG TPA: hypothetical protein V6C86_03135 [Oculatellaceae cyanobacterium]
MKKRFRLAVSLLLTSLLSPVAIAQAEQGNLELRGPVPTQGTTAVPENQKPVAGFIAPGADAMMTQDMLLVNPTPGSNAAPRPLQAFIGQYLKMDVERTDISFDGLSGIKVLVVNETNRPLIIDGTLAEAVVGGKTFKAIPVETLEQAALPTKMSTLDTLMKKILPATVTVGAVPTLKDFKEMKKPVLDRYGPDEVRRRVELSRFGRRILWPHQQTEGVFYFEADSELTGAKVTAPASTLFDNKDSVILGSTP